MGSIKVCMLTTSFPSSEHGSEAPFVYELCKALSKKEVTLHVICPRDGMSKKEEFFGDVHVHRFNYFFPHSLQRLTSGGGIPANLKESVLAKIQLPLFLVFLFFRSLQYTRQCDIIHCQWSLSAAVGVVLKKIFHKPLLVTERGSSAHLALKSALTAKILHAVIMRCDAVTTNNEHQIEIFTTMHISAEKLYAIPNGIDIKKFKPRNKKACRKKLGIDISKKVVLFVGRLVEVKGPEYLLKAIALIAQTRNDILCYFVGDGLLRSRLEEFTRSHKLTSSVIFVGAQQPDRIPYYLCSADVVVLPSLAEGRPNVMGEAFACGIPVVASDLPGTREYFTLVPFGILVQPQNTERLSQSILTLLEGKESKEIYRNQLKRLRQTLTWENSAEAYLNLYGLLIKK